MNNDNHLHKYIGSNNNNSINLKQHLIMIKHKSFLIFLLYDSYFTVRQNSGTQACEKLTIVEVFSKVK
jgi:hypothetical protein